eukprot:4018126-Prymnesium_polylepis.1
MEKRHLGDSPLVSTLSANSRIAGATTPTWAVMHSTPQPMGTSQQTLSQGNEAATATPLLPLARPR